MKSKEEVSMGKTIYTQRKSLLEGTFKVWCQNQVSDYRVSLTLNSIYLQPVSSKGKSRSSVKSCCSFCHPVPKLEVIGRDIVSCRPSNTVAINTKFNMGPPLFMLITYPRWNKSSSRLALYFHWTKQRPAYGEDDDAESEQDDILDINANESDTFAEIMKIKEEWIRALYEIFFPWLVMTNTFKTFRKGSSAYLSRKLLVVLNPEAGNGTALKIFKERIVPVFRDAGLEYEMMVTEYQNHVFDVIRIENLARWRGVVSVGGDGTLVDIYNGLFVRSDWQDALGHLAVCSVPVSSNGTTRNAFSRSMCFVQGEGFDPGEGGTMSGVINAARGRVSPIDLIFVQTKNSTRVALTNLSFGPHPEHDLLKLTSPSTSSRGLGFFTKTQMPFRRMKNINSAKSFSAVLSFLPVENKKVEHGSQSVPENFDPRSNAPGSFSNRFYEEKQARTGSCSSCNCSRANSVAKTPVPLAPTSLSSSNNEPGTSYRSEDEPLLAGPPRSDPSITSRYNYTSLLTEGQLYFRSWQELDVRLRHSGPFPMLNHHPALMKPSISPNFLSLNDDYKHQSHRKMIKRPKPYFPSMPEMCQPLPQEAGWVIEVGDFISIHLLNQPFIDRERCLNPNASPDDGNLWLVLIRSGISKRSLYNFLTIIESGGTDAFPDPLPEGIEMIAVRGIRIAPLPQDGTILADGVHLEPCECVQAFVMPGVARTLVK